MSVHSMFCFANSRLRVFYIPNVVDAPKVRAMALACLFPGVADVSLCLRRFFRLRTAAATGFSRHLLSVKDSRCSSTRNLQHYAGAPTPCLLPSMFAASTGPGLARCGNGGLFSWLPRLAWRWNSLARPFGRRALPEARAVWLLPLVVWLQLWPCRCAPVRRFRANGSRAIPCLCRRSS